MQKALVTMQQPIFNSTALLPQPMLPGFLLPCYLAKLSLSPLNWLVSVT